MLDKMVQRMCKVFIDWLLQALAFQFQCRWRVSWRWWSLLLTVPVLVFSHLLTSAVSAWHQFDGARSPARALPLSLLPRQRRTAHLKPLTSMASSQSALDFRSHASRRSAMCEAMLRIVVQVFHIGEPNFSARPCSTNGLDHLIASLSGQLLQH